MAERVTVFSSRKAYEFRPEGIRLTLLSLSGVQEQIIRAFSFQVHAIGTPQATFGEVPATFPPGLVFNFGNYIRPNGQPVPIRLLHIEPHRIIVDVAGLSSDAEAVYGQLRDVVADLSAPDGGSAIGDPYQTRDYSEVVLQLHVSPSALVPEPVLTAVRDACRVVSNVESPTPIPIISFQLQDAQTPFPGIPAVVDGRQIQLAPRQGYPLSERMYFSAAPFDSAGHLQYLEALDQAIAASVSPSHVLDV